MFDVFECEMRKQLKIFLIHFVRKISMRKNFDFNADEFIHIRPVVAKRRE